MCPFRYGYSMLLKKYALCISIVMMFFLSR
jgi:hypothetical protein